MDKQENPFGKAGGKPPSPILISGSEAILPWQPERLQRRGQGGTEGDACLHFVSWVIGPAEQGQL